MALKILVVDDDAKVRAVVQRYLTDRGLSVVVTDNGSQVLLLARESRPDLVLVDAEMPGLDGHSVCRILKKDADSSRIPVILMSGCRMDDEHVLSGFEGGADDYIMKPFSLPVLLARIKAVLGRYAAPGLMAATLKKCGIELDPAGRTVAAGGKPIALTRKEFDLLAALLGKPGRVLSIRYLLETVWGYDPSDYNDTGTVEVHVSHLRRKLGPKIAKRIVTVIGHGYKLET